MNSESEGYMWGGVQLQRWLLMTLDGAGGTPRPEQSYGIRGQRRAKFKIPLTPIPATRGILAALAPSTSVEVIRRRLGQDVWCFAWRARGVFHICEAWLACSMVLYSVQCTVGRRR